MGKEYNVTFINRKNYDKEDGIFVKENSIPYKHKPIYLLKFNSNDMLRFGVSGRLWD